MSEALVSGGFAVILVLVQFVGSIVAKWRIVRLSADREVLKAEAQAAMAFDSAQVPAANDPLQELMESMKAAKRSVIAERFRTILPSATPGPELCFIAMTIAASLFIALNYASGPEKQLLSPLLASSTGALPIIAAVFLLSLVLWWATSLWREALVERVQVRHWQLSMIAITAIGGSSLALCIYLIVAGR